MKRAISLLTLLACFVTGSSLASEYNLPFSLATVPQARLLVSDTYDSGAEGRVESVARFGTQLSLQEVIAFYETALVEAGFKISLPSDSGNRISISGKRDRDRIRLTVKSEGSWSDPGENEITIVAEYDKK